MRMILISCMLVVLLLFALSACAPQALEVAEAGEPGTDEALQKQYPSGLDEALEDLEIVEE